MDVHDQELATEVAVGSRSLDYGKWDKLVLSDSDDDKPKKREPLLRDVKSYEHHERDAALTEHFVKVLRKHLGKEKYPLAQRKLLARFIAVQCRGDEPSNVYRYSDISAMVAQYSQKLLRKSSVDLLCELHNIMIKSTDDNSQDGPVRKDAQTVLEALNALEAIKRHGSAPDFFEKVCSPSHSDSARETAEKYEKNEYAKMAMMRFLFGDQDYEHLEEAHRRRDELRTGHSVDWDVCKAVFYAVLGILTMVGTVAYLINHIASTPQGKASVKQMFGLYPIQQKYPTPAVPTTQELDANVPGPSKTEL